MSLLCRLGVHKKKIVHREETRNYWIEHQLCRRCGAERLISETRLSMGLGPSIECGIAKGTYTGINRLKLSRKWSHDTRKR